MRTISIHISEDSSHPPTILVNGKPAVSGGTSQGDGGEDKPRRYLITHRRAHLKGEAGHQKAKERLDSYLNRMKPDVQIVHDTGPRGPLQRRIVRVDARPADIERHRASAPADVIIEEEIFHEPQSFTVAVTGKNAPLQHVNGTLTFKDGSVYQATSGPDGQLNFQTSPLSPPTRLRLDPPEGFWEQLIDNPSNEGTINIPELKQSHMALGWWHNFSGIQSYDSSLGSGISVGIIDTGTGPHEYLKDIHNLGSYLNGVHDQTPQSGEDVGSHGTHVAGLIGAKAPEVDGPYVGIAPGVTLHTARVFASDAHAASNGDICMALDDMAERNIHLVSLSLGSSQPSMLVYDAILAALNKGTLTVCATGNDGGGLCFPAAFKETIAVAAFGRTGEQPDNTPSSKEAPATSEQDRYDQITSSELFVPRFSNFGRDVSGIAPGVGIISTIPYRPGLTAAPYGVKDGTSMASSIFCATLAILLSKNPAYKGMPPGLGRAQVARKILKRGSNRFALGVSENFEGRGLLVSLHER